MTSQRNRLPHWSSPRLGLRVKLALFLATEVGEGRRFTLQQLREALGDQPEIGRRLRDLRSGGWSIRSSRDDPGLARDEYWLERIGAPVWEKEHRADGLRQITARIRQEALARDGYRCTLCGALAGEPYPDNPSTTAQLTVRHIVATNHGGTNALDNLATVCSLCNVSTSSAGDERTTAAAWERTLRLTKNDQARLLAWLVRGRREMSPLEAAATSIFRLPPADRDEIRARLAEHLVD